MTTPKGMLRELRGISFSEIFGSPYLYVPLAFMLSEQAAKLLIDNSFEFKKFIPIVNGMLGLYKIRNYGGGFGVAKGMTTTLLLSGTLSTALSWKIHRSSITSYGKIASALFFCGGSTHLLERLAKGYVLDYLLLKPGSIPFINWPYIFDLADVAITTGVGMGIGYLGYWLYKKIFA